jgi:hypothetical protein
MDAKSTTTIAESLESKLQKSGKQTDRTTTCDISTSQPHNTNHQGNSFIFPSAPASRNGNGNYNYRHQTESLNTSPGGKGRNTRSLAQTLGGSLSAKASHKNESQKSAYSHIRYFSNQINKVPSPRFTFPPKSRDPPWFPSSNLHIKKEPFDVREETGPLINQNEEVKRLQVMVMFKENELMNAKRAIAELQRNQQNENEKLLKRLEELSSRNNVLVTENNEKELKMRELQSKIIWFKEHVKEFSVPRDKGVAVDEVRVLRNEIKAIQKSHQILINDMQNLLSVKESEITNQRRQVEDLREINWKLMLDLDTAQSTIKSFVGQMEINGLYMKSYK